MITWKRRVKALRKTGLTYREIGAAIGLSVSSVSDIANGHTNEPSGLAAVKLHALHLERCPTKAAHNVA